MKSQGPSSSSTLQNRILKYYRDAYTGYRDSVLWGTRVCSKAERQKVERQERDIKQGVAGYEFILDEGLKPLLWITMNLCIPLGRKRGQPMKLEAWQAYDTIVLFGWVKKDDHGRRRFVDAFWEIARKNGKSTFSAALLDYLIFGETPGVRGYIGATTLEQAEEVFVRCEKELSLVNKDVSVANSKNNKVLKWRDGVITAIAGEPKDGKLAYGTVIDEYHQHRDNGLINSIRFGNISDQQSLLIRITTAGVSLGGVCHEEYKKCKRVLSRELDIPRYFISIYEVDEFDSPDDPSIWPKANPNWGVSIDPDDFRANYDSCKASATEMLEFKTKNLNMWCHSLSRWANMPVWMERCRWTVDEDDLIGKPAYGGLDLSSVSDFTAFTLDFPLEDGRHMQLSHFWIPDAMVETLLRQCRIPLREWIEKGWVTATPGNTIDYNYVMDYLNDCYEKYEICFIAADKWKINELVNIMPPWFIDVAYEFSQGMKTMSPTIRDFEKAYLEGKVSANSNEVIDWMMSCAETYQDSSGNVKIVKPKQRTESRIDGVITSIMALSNAKTNDIGYLGDVSHMITAW